MASRGEPVLFELEDETRYYKWRLGRVELDPIAGAITIHGDRNSRFTITIPVSEIIDCEIVEREDINTFGPMWSSTAYSDPSGGILTLLLAPLAIIDTAAAKSTSFPVIKLTQAASGDQEQGWMIYLRSRKRGRNGQIATREMAHRVVVFLHQNGYCGPIPEL